MAKAPATTEAKPAADAAAKAAAAAGTNDTPPAPPAPSIEKPKAAPAAKEAAPAAPQRKVSPIIVSRWSEASFIQQRHAITPEAGTQPKDLLDPGYYAHIAAKLRAGDIIEARPADGAYYAELYVWAKGEAFAQVSLLVGIDRPGSSVIPSGQTEVPGFSIAFVEGSAKHRIIRDSDQVEISRGFDTPAAANAWLKHNKDRIAA